MLHNILSQETCAGCRICCSFVAADVWEAPEFTQEELEKITALGISKDKFLVSKETESGRKTYKAKYKFADDKEILLCPCLDETKGCMLGQDKPFECSIWPIRIFENEEGAYLGLAEICPAFADDKDRLLRELKENGLEEKIMAQKNRQPVIKPVEKGYLRL